MSCRQACAANREGHDERESVSANDCWGLHHTGRSMAPHSLCAAPHDIEREIKALGQSGPPPARGRHILHSNYMLNRGYGYTTNIGSKHHGQTLLSHLASLYPHSTPQVWQQKLNNGEVTLNGVIATGSESVTSGQT